MPSELERRAVARLVQQAENLGAAGLVPAGMLALSQGHGPRNGGAFVWDRLHPDDDQFYGCCWGDINKGPAYCNCWVPEYDLVQADPILPGDGEAQTRPGGMCGDCAYRPGSPELNDQAEELLELPLRGETFWCHEGIRRAIRWQHPDGRVVDGDPADYQPPMLAGRPHRADGRVGSLCAGWAACSRRWDNLFTKEREASND